MGRTWMGSLAAQPQHCRQASQAGVPRSWANSWPLDWLTTRDSSRSHLLPAKTTEALLQACVLIWVHLPTEQPATAYVRQTQTIPHRQHSTSVSDTEHPTQTTQHMGFRHRHRTSHTDNTARVCHRHRTSHTACVHYTDTEHPTQTTQHMYIRHREHSMRASDTDQEHSTCMSKTKTQHMSSDTDHPTQRTQHMCITHREHSMGCQTQTQNTACAVRHRWRTQNVLSDTDTEITACVHQTQTENTACVVRHREHSMSVCQTQRTQHMLSDTVKDHSTYETKNTAHVHQTQIIPQTELCA